MYYYRYKVFCTIHKNSILDTCIITVQNESSAARLYTVVILCYWCYYMSLVVSSMCCIAQVSYEIRAKNKSSLDLDSCLSVETVTCGGCKKG